MRCEIMKETISRHLIRVRVPGGVATSLAALLSFVGIGARTLRSPAPAARVATARAAVAEAAWAPAA
jgi:hypothetical protein